MAQAEQGHAQAFTSEVLRRLRERDDPAISAEVDFEGPWEVQQLPDALAWGVYRRSELRAGKPPLCRFADRRTAVLAAAVLPAMGRRRPFVLRREASAHGYVFERDGVVVGSSTFFIAALNDALNIVDVVARSAVALALLLEVSGGTVLEQVGRELALRLEMETTTARPSAR